MSVVIAPSPLPLFTPALLPPSFFHDSMLTCSLTHVYTVFVLLPPKYSSNNSQSGPGHSLISGLGWACKGWGLMGQNSPAFAYVYLRRHFFSNRKCCSADFFTHTWKHTFLSLLQKHNLAIIYDQLKGIRFFVSRFAI